MQAELTGTPAADETSDAVLLLRTREGDSEAYGSLYLRHVAAARVLARQLARDPSEADELVAESFTRVLGVLQRGAGPEAAFRPYLLSTMRRLHVDRRVAEKQDPAHRRPDAARPGRAVRRPAGRRARALDRLHRLRLVAGALAPGPLAHRGRGPAARPGRAAARHQRQRHRGAGGPGPGRPARRLPVGPRQRRHRPEVPGGRASRSAATSAAPCRAASGSPSTTTSTRAPGAAPPSSSCPTPPPRCAASSARSSWARPSSATARACSPSARTPSPRPRCCTPPASRRCTAPVPVRRVPAGRPGPAARRVRAAPARAWSPAIAARPTWQLVGAAGVAGVVVVATALAFALTGSPSRQVADNPGSSPTAPQPSATSTAGTDTDAHAESQHRARRRRRRVRRAGSQAQPVGSTAAARPRASATTSADRAAPARAAGGTAEEQGVVHGRRRPGRRPRQRAPADHQQPQRQRGLADRRRSTCRPASACRR